MARAALAARLGGRALAARLGGRALAARAAQKWADVKNATFDSSVCNHNYSMVNYLFPYGVLIKIVALVAKFDINESAEGRKAPRRALDLRAVDRRLRKLFDSLGVEDFGAVLVGDISRDLQWYLYRRGGEQGGDISDARNFFFSGQSARMSIEGVVAKAKASRCSIPGDRAVVVWYFVLARFDVEPPDVCFKWLLRLVGEEFPALHALLSMGTLLTFEETLAGVRGALARAPVDKKGSLVSGWDCYDPHGVGVVLLSRCQGRPAKNKILKEFCRLAGHMSTCQLPAWLKDTLSFWS